MTAQHSSDPRLLEASPEEAQLEAFKGVLLLALARLPGMARSQLALQVEQEANHLRSMRGGDPDRLAFHLEGFARIARLMPPTVMVEAVMRRRTLASGGDDP